MLFPDLLFAFGSVFLILAAQTRRAGTRAAGMRSYGLMFGIWFLFNQGVARPVVIPSGSMEPALHVGDRLLVDVLSYKATGAHRGDVLAFTSPEGEKLLCKRVLGLPGERIAVHHGKVEINGKPLRDWSAIASDQDYGPYTVPPHHLFMMGDNRNNSYDSRYFGPVPEELVMGRMELLFWPPTRAAVVHP